MEYVQELKVRTLTKENKLKQYHLTTRYKLYYSVISLLFLIPAIGFVYLFRYNAICYSSFLILVLFATLRAIIWFRSESITISEKSIIYRTIDITIESIWSDVQSIKDTFINYLFTKQECLVIDESQMRIVQASIFGMIFRSTAWKTQQPMIPLSSFSDNWRNSELGQQIKQYAPHLFEKEKSA